MITLFLKEQFYKNTRFIFLKI